METTYSTFVALTSPPVVVLSPDTPVQETEIRGRKSLVFTGENPKDYIIGEIQPSGLPVPNVKIIDGETRQFIIKTNDFQVPVIQSLGSVKVIENLPDPSTSLRPSPLTWRCLRDAPMSWLPANSS
jgi:hypothetical protein